MTRYDVIIAGAGPAGSTAARECAARGLSVLLVEKEEFPRAKPCGGAVSLRAARLLPFELGSVAEREIRGVWWRLGTREWERRGAGELGWLTQRSRLDAYLAERAVEAGAHLREGAKVVGLERGGHGATVRIEGGEAFEGRAIVAADGVQGRTAQLAGLTPVMLHARALEWNITPRGGMPSKWTDMLGLDLGAVPGGYGWVFPKGDHLNVGLGAWPRSPYGRQLRHRLPAFTRSYGLALEDAWGSAGYSLPSRRPGSPLADGNVLLAGDAGGVLDPFTGEGIYAAVWTGRTAAGYLAAYCDGRIADLRGYEREVDRVIAPELVMARRLYDVLYTLSPSVGTGLIVGWPALWDAIRLIVRGDRTYLDARARLGPLAHVLDLWSDAWRLTSRFRRLTGLKDPPGPERFFRERRLPGGGAA